MHQLYNNSENKFNTYLYSFIISYLIYGGLIVVIKEIYAVPWYINIPSFFGVYRILLLCYEHIFWKYNIPTLPKIPDLNGEWSVNIKSSFKNSDISADLIINQTYSKILIIMKTEKSTSFSNMATINKYSENYKTITYTYLNKPKSSASKLMHLHEGTVFLEINTDENKLEGYYYSGRDRENYGDLIMMRKKLESSGVI